MACFYFALNILFLPNLSKIDKNMLTDEMTTRVRYAETDQMGYVYYGNYAQFFEMGRTEMMRKLGLAYNDLENQGIMLPVSTLKEKFIKPAKYDEVLTIRTILRELPTVRIIFEYEIYNEAGELINQGETTLVFVDSKARRPMRVPVEFQKKIAGLLGIKL
jgi:acyl-CoA thioester hydrolase